MLVVLYWGSVGPIVVFARIMCRRMKTIQVQYEKPSKSSRIKNFLNIAFDQILRLETVFNHANRRHHKRCNLSHPKQTLQHRLDLSDGNTDNGTKVQGWDSNAGKSIFLNQCWQISLLDPCLPLPYYTIKNLRSGSKQTTSMLGSGWFCCTKAYLDLASGSAKNRTHIRCFDRNLD